MNTTNNEFATWGEVLDAARRGQPIDYRAPLDPKPTRLRPRNPALGSAPYTYEVRVRTIRIWPPGSVGRGRTADPFTADAGHVDRFTRV